MNERTRSTVELIPARPQALWGKRAVANFFLGGLGTGAYTVATLTSGFGPSPAVDTASWLGPLLVLSGMALVASEAGRSLRGPRVLARVETSWMSREVAAGGAFALLALGAWWTEAPWLRGLAAATALATALAHGLILRRAQAVTAWSVPAVPLLFLSSALVSGAAAVTLAEAIAGRPPGAALLGSMAAFLVLDALAWAAYVLRRGDRAFQAATRELRAGMSWAAVAGGGHLVPLLLCLAAPRLPVGTVPVAVLAGALAIGGQIAMKAAVILMAGHLRPVTIPHLPTRRRPP